MKRRRFLEHAALAAGSIVTGATLSTLAACAAGGRPEARGAPYGALRRTADAEGNVVLALPPSFQYVTFSKTGEAYAPGVSVARSHDGMACFARPGGIVRLIRNHEVRNDAGDFTLGVDVPTQLRYDARAMAGCMTLDFDARSKRLVRQFASLGGTMVNCSGGWSHRNSGWITCEETLVGPSEGFSKPHGYCFHVPASADSTVPAVPLTALGRFAREAAVADENGVVYQTEDAGNASGFYRFTPDNPGELRSGKLQMLAVRGREGANLYQGQHVGARLPVTWVDIANPDPDLDLGDATCFAQGRARGGAAFNRLEGLFRGEDGRSMYFLSTSGGDRPGANAGGYGQLWQYAPSTARQKSDELVLVFESSSGHVLESPDNLCLTPRGAILFCEDDALGDGDTHELGAGITEVNRLVGLDGAGEPFTFAVNVLNASELAGACFSPDGEILFVNVYGDRTPGSGMTCAIWGPWARGPL